MIFSPYSLYYSMLFPKELKLYHEDLLFREIQVQLPCRPLNEIGISRKHLLIFPYCISLIHVYELLDCCLKLKGTYFVVEVMTFKESYLDWWEWKRCCLDLILMMNWKGSIQDVCWYKAFPLKVEVVQVDQYFLFHNFLP